jgi:transcriptional regulator with XRE-family HTH domain
MQRSLAHKLRILRAEHGLTLREAASLTGVAKETLSDIERGLRHPHDPTLAKIAKGYGLPVEELLEEAVAAGKAEARRSSPETETSRRAPDVDRLSSNLQDRIRDFLRRWIEVADYLQRLEGEPAGGYVWLLDLHRNVTREAAFLLRDVVELGDYVGLASNVPQPIEATAEMVRGAVDLAVARAELKEATELGDVLREQIADRLVKTKPEEEDKFDRVVVDFAAWQERRRVSDSDDTTAVRGAG